MGRGRGARSRIRAGERGTVRPARRRPATARRGSPWTWPQREVGRDTSRRGGGGSAIGSGRWRASGPDPRSAGARKGWDRRGKSRWAAAWNFHRSNGNCRWAGFGHPGVVVKRGPLRAGALRPVWYGRAAGCPRGKRRASRHARRWDSRGGAWRFRAGRSAGHPPPKRRGHGPERAKKAGRVSGRAGGRRSVRIRGPPPRPRRIRSPPRVWGEDTRRCRSRCARGGSPPGAWRVPSTRPRRAAPPGGGLAW